MSTIPHLAALRAFVAERAIRIADERPIDHGYQLRLTRGSERVGVNLYSSGKLLVQGAESALKRELQDWKQQVTGDVTPAPAASAAPELLAPLPHIGVDEAGKGDYFGPLVIAAVAVDEASATELVTLGVRDGKQLEAAHVRRLAARVRALCPHAELVLDPPRYNELHAQHGANLNRLLAWGHAEAIALLSEQAPQPRVVADQFGDERLIERALRARGLDIELTQRPRAEVDIAVAAASLLARATFVAELERLGQELGLALPLGASDLHAIRAAGRRIVQAGGRDLLGRVAKLHFKTSAQILDS
jgi:ribonuclease HIII